MKELIQQSVFSHGRIENLATGLAYKYLLYNLLLYHGIPFDCPSDMSWKVHVLGLFAAIFAVIFFNVEAVEDESVDLTKAQLKVIHATMI